MANTTATKVTATTPTMPLRDTHAIPTIKSLGFPSAIVFDGIPDHDGKQQSSQVWLAVQSGKSIKSLHIGSINDGRWHPVPNFQTSHQSFIVSDLADLIAGNREKSGPTVAAIAEILDREIRKVAIADWQDLRESQRQKSQQTAKAKAESRLAAIQSLIG